jgi:hypothetical protein
MVQAGNEAALLPTRTLRWKAVAESVGGRYEPGDFWSPERVVLPCPPWSLTLHAEAIQIPLTLVTADYVERSGLRLTLLCGEFQRPWHGIDLASIPVGGPAFHSRVQLTASDPARAHSLFARPGLRQKLLALPHTALDIRRGRLRLATLGIIDDPESLIMLLSIGVEILQTLQNKIE